MICSFKKRCSQKCCFGFYSFGFEMKTSSQLNPIELVTSGISVNYYLASTVYKTHHGQVIAPFSVQVLQFFLLVRWRCLSSQPFLMLLMIFFAYEANYNTQGGFVIIFFIRRNLLNCLRSVVTILRTTKGDQNSLKKKFLTARVKAAIFCSVDVFPVYSHPRNFKFNRKY